jgi:protein tyrosine phosphatase (PTP) superfamily phosphohydrolase (DUF442 family)
MQADPQDDQDHTSLPQRYSGIPQRPLTPLAAIDPLRRFWRYWMRDHAFLRVVLPNAYRVDEALWRGGHPGRAQLRRLKAQGVATILNLRGGSDTVHNATERALCAELGIPLVFLETRAGALPEAEVLLDLLKILRDAPKPLFVHCKSGADRTALAVTLYLHVLKGRPLDEARRAFSWRYGHIRWGKARVLHHFLDAYAEAHRATGVGFEDWLETGYNRAVLEAAQR